MMYTPQPGDILRKDGKHIIIDEARDGKVYFRKFSDKVGCDTRTDEERYLGARWLFMEEFHAAVELHSPVIVRGGEEGNNDN